MASKKTGRKQPAPIRLSQAVKDSLDSFAKILGAKTLDDAARALLCILAPLEQSGLEFPGGIEGLHARQHIVNLAVNNPMRLVLMDMQASPYEQIRDVYDSLVLLGGKQGPEHALGVWLGCLPDLVAGRLALAETSKESRHGREIARRLQMQTIPPDEPEDDF